MNLAGMTQTSGITPSAMLTTAVSPPSRQSVTYTCPGENPAKSVYRERTCNSTASPQRLPSRVRESLSLPILFLETV